jgi:hypothetical protein
VTGGDQVEDFLLRDGVVLVGGFLEPRPVRFHALLGLPHAHDGGPGVLLRVTGGEQGRAHDARGRPVGTEVEAPAGLLCPLVAVLRANRWRGEQQEQAQGRENGNRREERAVHDERSPKRGTTPTRNLAW